MKHVPPVLHNGASHELETTPDSIYPIISVAEMEVALAPVTSLQNDFRVFRENLSSLIDMPGDSCFPRVHPEKWEGAYGQFIAQHQLDNNERLFILLALSQYLDPSLLNVLAVENNSYRLVQCTKTGQLLPTGETFLRLAAGSGPQRRVHLHQYFSTEHIFYRKSIIDFGEVNEGMAHFFGVLKLTASFRELFLYEKHSKPRFGSEFPAHLLETHLGWDDLVINPATEDRLGEIRHYLDHNETLRKEWGLSKHMKDGYRCLFYGPSGTGKTLAATLLGKHIGRDVYRVDISSVISKYIGETSKNLNSLFTTAEDKGWILFFDEGDALFGKRVDTASADDKNVHFANQDIAYLLQRIENYNGLVIVASNFRKNMDDAFSRRFQSVVLFDLLNSTLSRQYWEHNLPAQISFSPAVDLDVIVKRHLLSPAAIMNVINRLCLRAISRKQMEISLAELELCIKDEMYK